MRHERSIISEARARVGAGVFSLRDGIQEVIKHFEVILFWAVTVISMAAMIKLRHQQPSLWHRGLAEDIEGLWEPWMRLVDELLTDEQLLDTVYEAQGERHPQSRSRGRMQTPAEVLLRLLLLSTCGTGAMTCWNERCGPIWCIARNCSDNLFDLRGSAYPDG